MSLPKIDRVALARGSFQFPSRQYRSTTPAWHAFSEPVTRPDVAVPRLVRHFGSRTASRSRDAPSRLPAKAHRPKPSELALTTLQGDHDISQRRYRGLPVTDTPAAWWRASPHDGGPASKGGGAGRGGVSSVSRRLSSALVCRLYHTTCRSTSGLCWVRRHWRLSSCRFPPPSRATTSVRSTTGSIFLTRRFLPSTRRLRSRRHPGLRRRASHPAASFPLLLALRLLHPRLCRRCAPLRPRIPRRTRLLQMIQPRP